MPALVGRSHPRPDDARHAAGRRSGPGVPRHLRLVELEAPPGADLRGRVVVVHFWTNGCINCIHNYPSYRELAERYADKDVAIVGVHTAEFDEEKGLARVREQADKNGLTFPIAVNDDGATWRAWDNHFWPAIYLVDKNGRVRHRWEGELRSSGRDGDAVLRGWIDELLAEK